MGRSFSSVCHRWSIMYIIYYSRRSDLEKIQQSQQQQQHREAEPTELLSKYYIKLAKEEK